MLVLACRYDDLKSAQDNIDLQSTILSRFDLIFIVKDPATEERDAAIARKVRNLHFLPDQLCIVALGWINSRSAWAENVLDVFMY